jgi:hypothetical protein
MLPLLWGIIGAVAVLVAAILVGFFKGRGAFGVLVDTRGKYSLSRLQILLWTALVIGGYVGFAAPQKGFVNIPADVLGLLGIALGSTVVSTAIKANQVLNGQTESEGKREQAIAASAQNEMLRLLGIAQPELLSSDEKSALLAHLSAEECAELNRQVAAQRKPTFMDLFTQEQVGTEHLIDIGKLQMFAWTAVALAIYGAMLVEKLTLSVDEVRQLTELPNVTGTILTLMGISQAAYLGMKLPDQSQPA